LYTIFLAVFTRHWTFYPIPTQRSVYGDFYYGLVFFHSVPEIHSEILSVGGGARSGRDCDPKYIQGRERGWVAIQIKSDREPNTVTTGTKRPG
jgi:hypothetical protein